MDFFEMFKLFLASFGGAAVALAVLAKWLGNLWANKILEKDKARYSRELEEYKNQLEITRNTLARYHESQFSLYNALWGSLHDLKRAGDSLWEIASEENLNRFSAQLKNTEDMINRNALLIEDRHLRELERLMETFWNFRIGKETLIELRAGRRRIQGEDIRQTISENRGIREKYNRLILAICRDFSRRLRGETK